MNEEKKLQIGAWVLSPIFLFFLLMDGVMWVIQKAIEYFVRALLFIFAFLQIPRLRTKPRFVLVISLTLFLAWTATTITSCRKTIVQSPSTVYVHGYTRSDGTVVSSYTRRPSGIAMADDNANRETEWERWAIGTGWFIGCGAIGLFYISATTPPQKLKWNNNQIDS